MEDNIENNKFKIKVSEIISKCKRREDLINFICFFCLVSLNGLKFPGLKYLNIDLLTHWLVRNLIIYPLYLVLILCYNYSIFYSLLNLIFFIFLIH